MALTDVRIRQTVPTDKPQRLYDASGLYLEVSKTGAKLWRLKYRIGGREKRLALGRYPTVSLRGARAARDDARDLLAAGTDPAEAKREDAAAEHAATAHAFETVAREWYAMKSATWASGHAKRLMQRMEGDAGVERPGHICMLDHSASPVCRVFRIGLLALFRSCHRCPVRCLH